MPIAGMKTMSPPPELPQNHISYTQHIIDAIYDCRGAKELHQFYHASFSYLWVKQEKLCRGALCLTTNDAATLPNSSILTLSAIIKHVVSSVAEAEIAALF